MPMRLLTVNMYKNVGKQLGLLAALTVVSVQVFATDAIQAVPLIKLKSDSLQLKKICADLNLTCSEGANLWKKKASNDGKVYLIDSTPQLIELIQEKKNYKVVNSWRFKDYQHHNKNSEDGELGNDGVEIFPAFYPLNRQKFAIAVVQHWSTGYSGGGKSEQFADFVMLEPKGVYKLALPDIPFYSYEMIRACFSEKDYKTSPHCHDETGSSLSIQFKDIGKPYYQWTLNYTDFTWEAFKPEKDKVVEKHREVVMPFEQKKK